MNYRIDIIGPSGVGKSSFAKNILNINKSDNVINYKSALIKSYNNDIKSNALIKYIVKYNMPYYYVIMKKNIHKRYIDNEIKEWKNIEAIIKDTKPVMHEMWKQRILWLKEKIILNDYYEKNIFNYKVIHDESILHKIVNLLIAAKDGEMLLDNLLHNISKPDLLIYCKCKEGELLNRNIERNKKIKDRYGKYRIGRDNEGRNILVLGYKYSEIIKKYYINKNVRVIEVDTTKVENNILYNVLKQINNI